MRVLLLAAGSSIHTARWANGLARAGLRIHLATQHPLSHDLEHGIEVAQFRNRGTLGYILMAAHVKSLARKIGPDLVNAHFASGYGTTGRLANWHPYLLSVWGSDVYRFPRRSSLHRRLVQRNLLAADVVASTSHCMARQARMIAPGLAEISVTPFGVDCDEFSKVPSLPAGERRSLVIGTVKSMEQVYGIDILIKAFAMLVGKLKRVEHPLAARVSLRLVGDGAQTGVLRNLCVELGLDRRVTFVGAVPHAEVPGELSKIDVYVALSREESFGVAVLEAGAAGRPVVVSDASGLAEVVLDGITGLVVPRDNAPAAANALFELVTNPRRQVSLGAAARQHVREHYSWESCVEKMIIVYEDTIRTFRQGRHSN